MRAVSFRLWLIAFLTVGIASWWQLPTVAQVPGPAPQAGVLYGAGDSLTGKLGVPAINLSPPRLYPSPASPFSDVIDAALGADHSLVLRSDGSVWSFGSNQFGQLGLPQGTSSPVPVQISGLPPIVNVVAGANHSLVLDNTGAIWAFGSDATGQLGIGGNLSPRFAPVMIPTLSSVVDIAAGVDFSVAVLSDGTLWAWGNNQFLQLGNPGPQRTTPIIVPKSPGFFATDVSAGGRTAMARSNNGLVIAWGANGNSQIAPGGGFVPSGGTIASNVQSMAVGDSHVLLLGNNGTVAARGLGTSGQLGNGNASSSSVFVTVPGLSGVQDIAAGAAHSAAVLEDGSIWTWGSNSRNQLGTNSSVNSLSPTKLFGFPATGRSVVASGNSTFFLNQPGQIGVSVTAPINMSCNAPFSTQVSLTGYDKLSTTPNDIVLVLDESGSIGATDFGLLKKSAMSFVSAQNIGPQANRVGVVLFAVGARRVINLSSDKSQILNAINDIVYGDGNNTCIGCGIAEADEMLDLLARPTANRMMVVVTDGETNPQLDQNFESVVLDAQQTATLFAIGVGPGPSAAQINFIASDIPNVTTAFLSPDFTSLATIIANVSTDVVPAFESVWVTLDFGGAIVQSGPANATSGNVTPSPGQVSWYLPELGSAMVTLTVPQIAIGQNGTIPLFDSIQYDAGQGPFSVAVPTIDISGCPVSIELNPPTATHIVGQNHSATVAARNEFGQVASVPMLVTILSGPNAGRNFNVLPSGVPASISYSSSLAGTDTLRAFAIGYPSLPPVTATVEWKLPNQAPTANAGPDQTVPLNGSTTAAFTLQGSGSDDGQIQPLTFQWSQGGTPVGSTPSVTLSRGLGLHTFTLAAFDGQLSGNDSVHITVVDPTPPLVAPTITGPEGSNGWYTGIVAVTWKAVDHESTIISPPCPDLLLKDDGANQSVTCFAESAGGKTTGSASVSIDSEPPVVTVPSNVTVPALDTLTPVSYSGESATDATSGVASFGCLPASGSDFPIGPTTVTCTATDGAGNSVARTFTVTVVPATTSMPVLSAQASTLVGETVTVSAVLTRTSVPAGPLANQPVTFTLNGPSGPTVVSTSTDASGNAAAGFPATMRGVHTITATFAGSPALAPISKTTSNILVIQRTKLVVSPVVGTPGSEVTLSATLLAIPQDTPIPGAAVVLTSGGNPTPVMLNDSTDANGVTSMRLIYPATGSFVSRATFFNPTGYFGDGVGAPTTTQADGTVTIAKAVTSLAPLQLADHLIGDSLTVVTTLNRTSAPAGPMGGVLVRLWVDGPLGTTEIHTNTNASGGVSAMFALEARGVHTVFAKFDGDGTHDEAIVSQAITVYQKTALTLAPAAGAVGEPITFTATLTTSPELQPLLGQPVTISFGGAAPPQTALTNANGVVTFISTFPAAGVVSAQASFAAASFTDHTGSLPPVAETASTQVTIEPATTSLPVLDAPIVGVVLEGVTVSTQLVRSSAPTGPLGGQTVTFTLVRPDATTSQETAITDASGNATVSFFMSGRGVHTVSASFAGTPALKPVSASRQIYVVQRTMIVLDQAMGVAGNPITLGATLYAIPQFTPIEGELITLGSAGNPIPAGVTGTTDANGRLSANVIYPAAGSFVTTSSFFNPVGYFADGSGRGDATTATGNVTVTNAATSLASLQLAQAGLVGDGLTVSTTLSRTSAPVGSLPGMAVVFVLTAPGGGTTQLTGTTNAAGLATVTFTPSVSGAHTVAAEFAGTSALQGSLSNTATVQVYQRTKLTLSTASGPAGSPLSLTATLTALPSGAPLAGQAVDVSFGGAAPAQTLLTDGSGAVTFSVTLPNAGTYSAVASFSNGGAFFTNHAGAIPPAAETASAPLTATDTTPPIITSSVSGTLSASGWYTSDVSVSWTVTDPDGAVTTNGCGPTTVSTDGVDITLTCTAESAGGLLSKSVTFSRDATGPALTTSSNLSVPATSATGATVNYLAATATDARSGLASVSCAPPSGFFPIGTTTVACTATDVAGNSSAKSFTITVTVGDTVPPVITTTTPSVTSLAPPNHQMVPITIAVGATDNLGAPVCAITGVTSNEPQNGLGDGDTPIDWIISGPLALQLRAERSGKGDGRIYTIAVRCADAAGNAATSSTTVVVPKGKK
jgi:alpha-tubulin suppressor-like RCC1 family protein